MAGAPFDKLRVTGCDYSITYAKINRTAIRIVMSVKQGRSLFSRALILIAAVLPLITGCSLLPYYYVSISPTADVKPIKTVGVWRFRSNGQFSNSGSLMTRAFEEAFTANGFTLIEHSKLTEVIKVTPVISGELSLETPKLTPEVLNKVHRETGADAVFLGSIINSWCSAYPSYAITEVCRIECSFQMLDTKSGEVILHGRLFEEDWHLSVAVKQLARRVVKKLK